MFHKSNLENHKFHAGFYRFRLDFFVEIIQSDNKVAATFLRLCPELGETLTVEPMVSMGRNGQHIRMEWVTLTVAFFRT